MCRNVKRFYRQNEEVLDKAKGLSNHFINLSVLVDRLQIEFDKSISYSNGFSIERARKREDLQNNSIVISTAIINLRETLKYKPIEQLNDFVDLDMIELSVLNEEDLIDYASGLYDLMLVCEARLKIQGLRQKQIDAFVSALTLNALDYPMNKLSIEMRKEASLQSLKAYAELNEFITEKLDLAMASFESYSPEFYNQYLEARSVKSFDLNTPATIEGTLIDGSVRILEQLKYDRDREIRVSVEGGNAIWGLSNVQDKIEFARPVNTREKLNIICRNIGPSGNLILIQAVNPKQAVHFKVWITES
jgi:hypothetical protein